jgi:hypothetical protein
MNRKGLNLLLAAAVMAMAAWSTAAAGIKGEQPIPWAQLAKLDFKTGQIPAELEQTLKKGELRVAGYAVPVEVVDFDNIQEFILIGSKFGCCQGPPPNPNQIIEVTLKKGVPFDKLMETVYLTGKLSIIKTGNGEFGYQLKKGAVFEPEYDF